MKHISEDRFWSYQKTTENFEYPKFNVNVLTKLTVKLQRDNCELTGLSVPNFKNYLVCKMAQLKKFFYDLTFKSLMNARVIEVVVSNS